MQIDEKNKEENNHGKNEELMQRGKERVKSISR